MLIVGGPHPTTSFNEVLKDQNIDACLIGEGEVTLSEIISKMMKNDNQKLCNKELKTINGIAFVDEEYKKNKNISSQTRNANSSANGMYAESKVVGQY